jgi:hypothetical protein
MCSEFHYNYQYAFKFSGQVQRWLPKKMNQERRKRRVKTKNSKDLSFCFQIINGKERILEFCVPFLSPFSMSLNKAGLGIGNGSDGY